MSHEHNYSIEFTRLAGRIVADITGTTQIRLDEWGLATALFHPIPPRAVDLLRIGLGVYAADRLARRDWRQQCGGSRTMRLEVSVVEPDFWADERTLAPLREALELLSDDDWHLRFRACKPDTAYLSCPPDQRPPRVCLYSGGLDSAAGLATQLRANRTPMLAVTIRHQALQKRRTLSQLQCLASRYGADVRPIVVKAAFARPPQLGKQELSQRCRSFLFAAMAGAVACAEQSTSVEVYESGVGAINLPLLHGMATGARTTRSSHPRFLQLMGELVSRVAERRIEMLLPHRDRTKAEIVRTLAEDGLADLAASTVSCVHYPVRGKAKQCGCCPACIGRRQAMSGAGIVESDGAYECDLFGESHITNAVGAEKLLALKATLMQVDRLSELRGSSLPEWFLRYALGTRVAENPAALRSWADVLLRYRAEWLDLVAFGRSQGWEWARWLPASCAA